MPNTIVPVAGEAMQKNESAKILIRAPRLIDIVAKLVEARHFCEAIFMAAASFDDPAQGRCFPTFVPSREKPCPRSDRHRLSPGGVIETTKISRRVMLGGFAATAGGMVATAIPLPAPAAADAMPALSPEERLRAAIEELQAAAIAVIPSIADWRLCVKPDMDGCPLLVAAFTPRKEDKR